MMGYFISLVVTVIGFFAGFKCGPALARFIRKSISKWRNK